MTNLNNFTWRAALYYIQSKGINYPNDGFISKLLKSSLLRVSPEMVLRLSAYFTKVEDSRQLKNHDGNGDEFVNPNDIIGIVTSFDGNVGNTLYPSMPSFWLFLQYAADLNKCHENTFLSNVSMRIINGENYEYDRPIFIDLIPIYRPSYGSMVFNYVNEANVKLTTQCVSGGNEFIMDDYGDAVIVGWYKLMLLSWDEV